MDINYLLWLQGFREKYGSYFTGFFLKMTFWGELSTTLLVIAAVYWCLSKKYGTYLLLGFHANRLMNGIMKITVCAYRPWIRDPRVLPDETALVTATGYSFPSGHTTNAGVIFGSAVVDRRFRKGFRVLMLAFALAVGFRCRRRAWGQHCNDGCHVKAFGSDRAKSFLGYPPGYHTAVRSGPYCCLCFYKALSGRL